MKKILQNKTRIKLKILLMLLVLAIIPMTISFASASPDFDFNYGTTNFHYEYEETATIADNTNPAIVKENTPNPYNRRCQLNFEEFYEDRGNIIDFFETTYVNNLSVVGIKDYDEDIGWINSRALKYLVNDSVGDEYIYYPALDSTLQGNINFTSVVLLNETITGSILKIKIDNVVNDVNIYWIKSGNTLTPRVYNATSYYSPSTETFDFDYPVWLSMSVDYDQEKIIVEYMSMKTGASKYKFEVDSNYPIDGLSKIWLWSSGDTSITYVYGLDSDRTLAYSENAKGYEETYNSGYDFQFTSTRIQDFYETAEQSYELRDYEGYSNEQEFNYNTNYWDENEIIASTQIEPFEQDENPITEIYSWFGDMGDFKLDNDGENRTNVLGFSDKWNESYDYKLINDEEKDGIVQWGDVDNVDFTDWSIVGTGGLNCSISEEIEGRNNILSIHDTSAVGYVLMEYAFPSNGISSSLEFSIRSNDTTKRSSYYIKGDVGNALQIYFENDELAFYNGTFEKIIDVSDNVWYDIIIDFDCDTDLLDITVNGVEEITDLPFYFNEAYLDSFAYRTDNTDSSYSNHLDTLSLGWIDSYVSGSNRYRGIDGYVDQNVYNTNVSIIEELDDHNNVIHIQDLSNTNDQSFLTYPFVAKTKGVVSGWFYSNNTGKYNLGYNLYDGSNEKLAFGMILDKFKYYDGGWQDICDCIDDTWYYVEILFDCETDTFDFYLDGVLEGENLDFSSSATTIDTVVFKLVSTHVDVGMYFDALYIEDERMSVPQYSFYEYLPVGCAIGNYLINDNNGTEGLGMMVDFGEELNLFNLTLDFSLSNADREFEITVSNGWWNSENIKLEIQTDNDIDYYEQEVKKSGGLEVVADSNLISLFGNTNMWGLQINNSYGSTNRIHPYEINVKTDFVRYLIIDSLIDVSMDDWIFTLDEITNEVINMQSKNKYGNLGAIEFENLQEDSDEEINWAFPEEITDYDEFWWGVVLNHPRDYYTVQLSMGNYEYAYEFTPSGYGIIYDWGGGAGEQGDSGHSAVYVDCWNDFEIMFGIGQSDAYGAFPRTIQKIGDYKTSFGTINEVDDSLVGLEPTITILPYNQYGNATKNSGITIKGEWFLEDFTELINWVQWDIDYVYPEEYRLRCIAEMPTHDLTFNIPDMSAYTDYTYWNFQVYQMNIETSLEENYPTPWIYGWASDEDRFLITTFEFNYSTAWQYEETELYLNTDMFEFTHHGAVEMSYQNTYYFPYLDIDTCEESEKELNSEVDIMVYWVFYFTDAVDSPLDVLVGWLPPLSIMLIFPIAFGKRFGKKGGVIGLLFGFIVMGFSALIPLGYSILLCLFSLLMAIIIFKKYGGKLE